MPETGPYDAKIIYTDDADVEQEIGLFIYEQGEAKRSEQLVPLRPVRQDTGNNPDEQRPGLGDIFAQSDFSGGLGQERYHSPGGDREPQSDRTKFFKSSGFDISERGRLSHLHLLTLGLANDSTITHAVADGFLFVTSNEVGNKVKRTTNLTSWTLDDPGVASYDLASSGADLYAACASNGLRKRTGATDGWALYLAGYYETLLWAKDRLFTTEGGTSPRGLYEIDAAGPTANLLQPLPTGWSWGHMWELGAHIYAAAYSVSSNQSRIYHFGLNSSGAALEAKGDTLMPPDTIITGGGAFPGVSYLMGLARKSASVYVDVVYQAFAGEGGYLTYVLLLEGDNGPQGGPEIFSGLGTPLRVHPVRDGVLIPWTSGMDADHYHFGALKHNLARDALSFDIGSLDFTDPPVDAVFTYNDIKIVAGAPGLYYEDKTKFVAEASLVTSMADWNNAAFKAFDWIDIDLDPLPADASFEVYYTTVHVDEDDWTLAATFDATGSTGGRTYLDSVKSTRFALKFISYANPAKTAAPVLRGYSVRSDVTIEDSDSIERQVTLYAVITSGESRADAYSEPVEVVAREVREELWNLAHQQVTFEEKYGTWRVRLTGLADYLPALPEYEDDSGQTSEETYIMQLQLTGRKTS